MINLLYFVNNKSKIFFFFFSLSIRMLTNLTMNNIYQSNMQSIILVSSIVE